jgi:hypothetical protein
MWDTVNSSRAYCREHPYGTASLKTVDGTTWYQQSCKQFLEIDRNLHETNGSD